MQQQGFQCKGVEWTRKNNHVTVALTSSDLIFYSYFEFNGPINRSTASKKKKNESIHVNNIFGNSNNALHPAIILAFFHVNAESSFPYDLNNEVSHIW